MTSFYGGGVVIVQGGGGSGSGSDGVGISNAVINADGELVLYLTNGAIKNVGRVVGKDGVNGKDGIDGVPGVNGIDGKDGVTFVPTITEDGVLSWTNNGNLPNPPSINLLEGDIWNEFGTGTGGDTPKPPDPAELDKSEWIEF